MVCILDVHFFDDSIDAAVNHITGLALMQERGNRCVSATGAHGLVICKQDLAFKITLSKFYINLPDGMPGVWIGRMKGARKMSRCYGPDFFKRVMQLTRDKPINHFLCGGKEGVAEELKIACKAKFNNSNIVGAYCPPFRDLNEKEWRYLAEQIRGSNADIVWIGLSTPKQERFAERLALYCNVKFIITVGAAFDFHTDRVKQAPPFLQQFGLEWFFRLLMEPKRLWRRYLEVVPLFIYYNIIEFSKFAFRLK